MASTFSTDLVFVIVPHRPAFSPVATNSNARSVENVDAIYYPYGLIGVQTIVAPV